MKKREELQLGDIVYIDWNGNIVEKSENAAMVKLDQKHEMELGGQKYYALIGCQTKWEGKGKWSTDYIPINE